MTSSETRGKMSHTNENKFLNCTKCVESKHVSGLELFVTPTGDLGIQCSKHEDFVMVIPSDELVDHFMGIAMQPCSNTDCGCKEEVSH